MLNEINQFNEHLKNEKRNKRKLFLYGVVKRLKIRIKLFFVYIKWCFNDCVENYQDIKYRYNMETDKELIEIQKELENL
jgi:hypothetical protein